MALVSAAASSGERQLPLWKKTVYSALVVTILGLPLYLVGEVGYRRAFGIPLWSAPPTAEPEPSDLGDSDTRVMEFGSVPYHQAFERLTNPALVYVPRANFSRGAVRINSQGFRDREFPVVAEPGAVRIVVLGDSIVWGHRLRLDETFPKQLERLLVQRNGARHQVMNFGVSGYSLQQQVEFYRLRAAQFDPAVVIIGSCVNDFQYSSVEGDFFGATESGLLGRSYLLRFLRLAVSTALYRHWNVSPANLTGIVDVSHELQRLQASAPRARLMMVMFPHLGDLQNYRFQWHHDVLTKPARSQGLVVEDLLDEFRQHQGEDLGVDHIHPNAAGNAIAAEAAYQALTASGLVR